MTKIENKIYIISRQQLIEFLNGMLISIFLYTIYDNKVEKLTTTFEYNYKFL